MLEFITKGFAKIFGTKSERDLKAIYPYVEKINAEFAKLPAISDDELRQKTQELKQEIANYLQKTDDELAALHQQIADQPDLDIDKKEAIFNQIDSLELARNKQLEEVLMEILPRAFAIVKETARRWKENAQLVVSVTPFDLDIASRRAGITIEGDKAIWHNRWMAAGSEVTWEMQHYDVQLIGGIVLHQGKIAEMATGEGKTLVATLPAYLNALAGRGVHIVTVNDYLAKRDSEWMGPLFEFHMLRVDCIDKHQPNSQFRKNAYLADITYGTNNEFGFDYLRDNMARTTDELVQRKHHYAMVDEVDSVLVDDARTPLIISGPVPYGSDQQEYEELKPRVIKLVEAQRKLVNAYLAEAKKRLGDNIEDEEGALSLFRAFRGLPKSKALIRFLNETGIKQRMQKVENYYLADNAKLMPQADKPLFFTIDEKQNSVDLTEKGIDMITEEGEDKRFFILPDFGSEIAAIEKNTSLSEEERLLAKESLTNDYSVKAQRIHSVNQLLKAYTLFERDVEYIIEEGKVKIVDEQTGRVLDGRRYSDGLHQALEAKENVKVEDATQTYATITLQNYFRMYHKLAGMTGTAETEAGEFWEIYKLDVVVIPTNRQITRKDMEDKVYKTTREKYNAVIEEVQQLVSQGRPVLVGTTSVEISETLSRMLQMRKIPHQVLNAKQHAREAEIVANAGQSGTVTIATNMAGRGTDIKLSADSRKAGGLAIIGTERHESRRVDRQLRGRSGRQGDPGSSQFFVSLEDSLMRLFGSDRIARIMDRLGLEEGEVIQHSIITNSIERAQKKVEENHFGVRKRLLEYDNVMNIQREAIYKRRRNALFGERLALDIMTMFFNCAQNIADVTKGDYENFKLSALAVLGTTSTINKDEFGRLKTPQLAERLYQEAYQHYQHKNQEVIAHALPFLQQLYQQHGFVIGNISVPFTDHKKQITVMEQLSRVVATNGRSLISSMEQVVTLAIIDQLWKEHLRDMDDLRQQVQFASIEQKDPLLVYKFEAYQLFKTFIKDVDEQVVSFLAKAALPPEPEQGQPPVQEAPAEIKQPKKPKLIEQKAESESVLDTQSDNEKIHNTQPKQQVEVTKPIVSSKVANRNERVNVRYADGTIKRDVKYKNVEQDLKSNKCIIID